MGYSKGGTERKVHSNTGLPKKDRNISNKQPNSISTRTRGTITPDEIETVIKKLLTHKSPGPDSFTGEFHKAFKDELTPILHRLFQKLQEDGRLPNSFYEASIILIPKPDKDITKRKFQTCIAD